MMAMGDTLVYEAEVANGARVGYFDTHGRLPAMIEVIEFLPATQAMFGCFGTAPATGTAAIRSGCAIKV